MGTKTCNERTTAQIGERLKKTRDKRRDARQKIGENKTVSVEQQKDRLERYVAKVIQGPDEVAKRVLGGEPEAIALVTPSRKAAAESIQKGIIDFVPASFLDIGVRVKRAVARVVDANGEALGTGFLISPGLFLTNQHVIGDSDAAMRARVQFDFESVDGIALPPTEFRLAPDRAAMFSLEGELDYALVAIGDPMRSGS